VTGARSMRELPQVVKNFRLEGALENMRCPYLILHGGHDVLGVAQAKVVADYAEAKGVNVTFRVVSEEETGADHCQHDNPTLGQEIIADWLVKLFGIDERELRKVSQPALL
jgi:pimeloyl-ACP methyl ester carboxylesterase